MWKQYGEQFYRCGMDNIFNKNNDWRMV